MLIDPQTKVTEGEVGRALASGELNLAGCLTAMDRAADGNTDHIAQQMEIAYQQLPLHGRQVLRKFASDLNRALRNG